MDRKKIAREAAAFKEGRSYIHSEWTLGRGTETVLAGEIIGQLYQVSCIIDRIATITGQSFDDTVKAVTTMRNKDGAEVIKGGEVTKGSDFEQELTDRANAAAEKKYRQRSEAAEAKVASLEREVEDLESLVRSLQARVEGQRRTSEAEKAKLWREIDAKEAEARRLNAIIESLNWLEANAK